MELTSSFLDRSKHIDKIKKNKFDLLVVGGGITGAGVAREAALRGLSVCLIEKGDFGEGTSSRSSKLAHGGLRYLENLEFGLVSEALHERQNLLSMAPHLVKPLRFLMPIYKGDRVSAFKMKLGMILYDVLSAFNTYQFHEGVSPAEIKEDYPNLKEEGLKSGFLYSDALMDDDRLVCETLRSAVKAGAVVASYVEGKSYKVNGEEKSELKCEDVLTGEEFSVEASHTISCVGPWTDKFAKIVDQKWEPRMRPSKGVHISLPKDKLNLKTAVVMAADKQNRILFCIPREGFDIVGTTDTDFTEDPKTVRTKKEDVNYILNILKEYYPKIELNFDDILFSYAGVRPLVNDGSASESKVSRSHWIKTYGKERMTYITGGKYTTYLSMAEDCVNQVLQATELDKKFHKKRDTRLALVEVNTPSNSELAHTRVLESKDIKWTDEERNLFVNRHGAQAVGFISEQKDVEMSELEAYIAIHHYFCGSLKDFYFRRSADLLKGVPCVEASLPSVAEVFKKELCLSDEHLEMQMQDLKKMMDYEGAWRDGTY